MAIDQSPLGQQIQGLMEEIENDAEIPNDAQIGRVVTIVEVVGPKGKEEEFTAIRIQANARPYVTIGILEVAKVLQLKAMGV